MDIIVEFIDNFLQLSAEASPWLLLGLLIAGMMKVWVPSKILKQHLGEGKKAIIKAALIGAPLPLCSCGVIPVATELKRSGASTSATSSFLVATPETGIDSVSVSYALLGPVMAIYRPISAIISAIFTGLLVEKSHQHQHDIKATNDTSTSCCHQTTTKDENNSSTCCAKESLSTPDNFWTKALIGLRYSLTQLIDDIIIWLLIGLVFAAIIRTFIPETWLLSHGSGVLAMLMMIAISIPMYICATASTPIAAGFLLAGISPGTALVFMMAGPATNISTLGVIKNEMGKSVLINYLLGITISAISLGLLLDWGINYFTIDINQQMQHSHDILPYEFGLLCAGIILFFSVKPLRNLLITRVDNK